MSRPSAEERPGKIMAKAVPAAVVAFGFILAATAATSAEVTVTQKGKKFVPGEVTISVGDTIVFVNDDNVTHNVHSVTNGSEFDIGGQKVGVATRHSFTSRGVVTVRCAIHPKMKLVVTVK